MSCSPATPAPVRDAATVVLLRDGSAAGGPAGGSGGGAAGGTGSAGPPEVLLLRRSARSGFGASAWVFPGGGVDPADRLLDRSRWRGPDPRRLGAVLGHDPADAVALGVAAVRETFEEAGVLLARTEDGRPVDARAPALGALRRTLLDPGADGPSPVDLAAVLAAAGLVLDLGALTPLARWRTPRQERRRFDAVFFLAVVPPGQEAVPDLVETTAARWTTAEAALDEARAGRLPLMYPTLQTLEALAGWPSAAAAVGAAADQAALRVLEPHLVLDEEGRVVRVVHPDDPEYPGGGEAA